MKKSSWVERYHYAPPADPKPVVERIPVPDAVCPGCGSSDVRRYPIANQFGPRMVVKCQACMHTLSVERPAVEDMWPPYRAVTKDWMPAPIERAKD